MLQRGAQVAGPRGMGAAAVPGLGLHFPEAGGPQQLKLGGGTGSSLWCCTAAAAAHE